MPSRFTHRREGRRGRGQALVEFALIVPVFLLLLMSLLDFGRVVYAQHTINQDAAEGARVGAVSADSLTLDLPAGCTASPESPVGCDTRFTTRYAKIRAAARIMAPAVPMTDASITGGRKTDGTALPCSQVLAYDGGTPAMPDDAVTPANTNVANSCFYPNGVNNSSATTPAKIVVKVTVSVPIITPIISSILGGQIPLSATSEQLLQ
jgi:hypothetical protein